MRYTAMLRGILERAVRGEPATDGAELARIEAALTGQGAPAPRERHTCPADGET